MKKPLLIAAAIAAVIVGAVYATDLNTTFSSLKPQTNDTELVIAHKQAISAAPSAYSYISTTGTTTVTSINAITRVVIGTAGTADSSLILKDGTTTLATVSTAAQASIPIDAVLTTGTLKLISSGTTGALITATTK